MTGVTTISASNAQQSSPEVVATPSAPKPAGCFRQTLQQAAQSRDTETAALPTEARHNGKSGAAKGKTSADARPAKPTQLDSESDGTNAAACLDHAVSRSQIAMRLDERITAASGSTEGTSTGSPMTEASAPVDSSSGFVAFGGMPNSPGSVAADARKAIPEGGQETTLGCDATTASALGVTGPIASANKTSTAQAVSGPPASARDGESPTSSETPSASHVKLEAALAASSGALPERAPALTGAAAVVGAPETQSTVSGSSHTTAQHSASTQAGRDAIAAAIAAVEHGKQATMASQLQSTISSKNLGDQAYTPMTHKAASDELRSAEQHSQGESAQRQGNSSKDNPSGRKEPGPLTGNFASLRTAAAESRPVAQSSGVREAVAVPGAEVATAQSHPRSAGGAFPAEPEAAPRSVPADVTQEPDAAFAGLAINTARLVERLHDSEINLTLRSTDFGNIAVHTSMNHERLTAQIAVDRNELGRFLVGEAPALESRLSREHGISATIEVQQQGQSLSGNGGQSQPQPNSQRSPSTLAGERATTMPDIVVTPPILAVEGRLDIRA